MTEAEAVRIAQSLDRPMPCMFTCACCQKLKMPDDFCDLDDRDNPLCKECCNG